MKGFFKYLNSRQHNKKLTVETETDEHLIMDINIYT